MSEKALVVTGPQKVAIGAVVGLIVVSMFGLQNILILGVVCAILYVVTRKKESKVQE